MLSVQSWVTEEGVGGCLERDRVRIESPADDADPLQEAVMTSHRTVFNHVGLCVADRERSRRFYEGLLGFQFWWELEPPDDGTDKLLRLTNRSDCTRLPGARRLVLELLDYSKRDVHAGPERVMDQAGADASVAVGVRSSARFWRGRRLRRIGGRGDGVGAVGDDPRSRRPADRAARGRVAGGSATSAVDTIATTTYVVLLSAYGNHYGRSTRNRSFRDTYRRHGYFFREAAMLTIFDGLLLAPLPRDLR